MSEPHDVVKLLLARMESHPEEFRLKDPSYHDRWHNHMSGINTYGNEADKAALAEKVRDIRMGVIHEQVMDELLNGGDRRRKEEEEEENEYKRKVLIAVAQKKSQPNNYATKLVEYRNAAGAQGIIAKSCTSVILDTYANIGTAAAPQIESTLSSSAINQLKKALKIGE